MRRGPTPGCRTCGDWPPGTVGWCLDCDGREEGLTCLQRSGAAHHDEWIEARVRPQLERRGVSTWAEAVAMEEARKA
jgi:hypothetical protein